MGKCIDIKITMQKKLLMTVLKKDTKDTLIWKGVANKYDNVKDLLGESILYEVKYKNGDIKKFERKIKYTE